MFINYLEVEISIELLSVLYQLLPVVSYFCTKPDLELRFLKGRFSFVERNLSVT